MAAVRGKDFKLYLDTSAPPYTTPTWVEVTNVKDVTQNQEVALADASIRGSVFRQQVSTLIDLSVDFQMVHDPADTSRQAFETAFYNGTDVHIVILDGPITTVGSAGLMMLAQVSKFTSNQALEDVGLDDVTVIPAYSLTTPPQQVTVTTSGTVTPVPPPSRAAAPAEAAGAPAA